jgi:DNA-binding transcriptional LysR family regulator
MKNSDFNWDDLKYFLATARRKGLSGAAVALNASASTVSRRITALEKSLGATLFLRHQTGYLLTDDGAALFRRIEEVEQAIMATERGAVQAAHQGVAGQVRLATTEMLALHLVAPNLPQLHGRHPNLQVEMVVALKRVDLSRREADLALRVAPPGEDEKAGDYIASQAGTVRYGMYRAQSRGGRGQARPARRPAWRNMDHIAWDEAGAGLPIAKWLAGAFPGRAPVFTSNSMQAQYEAIRAGLGIGLLPEFVARRDPSLEKIEIDLSLPSNPVWLVYHRDLKASRRVIALRDFIRQTVERLLGPEAGETQSRADRKRV